MKRAIIFYNGDYSNLSRAKTYLRNTDYIICADGGAKHVIGMNITPNLIIGDFDSLSKQLQKKLTQPEIEWLRFPREKDATDSELALQFAVEKGFKQIIIFGLLGSRLDHLLTNIFALSYLIEQGIDVVFVEGNQEIRLCTATIHLKGKVGDLVSLLPLNGDAKGTTTKGLLYKLQDETLRFGYSRGISNVFTHSQADISIKNGQLLCIHTRQ